MHPDPAYRPAAAVITTGGVYLPAHLCEPLWRVLRAELARRVSDGGRIRPDIAQAVDTLRAAAMAHLATVSTNGRDPRTPADTMPPSPQPLITTADLATRLRVSERHARRVAATEGIAPLARNLWAAEDAAALAARREHP